MDQASSNAPLDNLITIYGYLNLFKTYGLQFTVTGLTHYAVDFLMASAY